MSQTGATGIFVALALAACAPALHAEPLEQHPALVEGRLENGLAYRVLSHAHPPGGVSLRLHLAVGSYHEDDDERGYAHLLEHLAFANSENFPNGSAVPAFSALGLTLGHHQSATTGFDQTVYMLDIPAASADAVDLGLTFLADVLGGIDITDGALEQERAVVLAERRARLGPMQRMLDDRLPRVFAGTRAADRAPIGTESSLRAATTARLRAFRDRWYTTGNATVIIVGDAPTEALVERITAAFGGLPTGAAAPPVDPGAVAHESAFAVVGSDDDIRTAQLTLMHLGPPRPPARTLPEIRNMLVDALASGALNRRLADAVSRGDTAFTAAFAGSGDLYGVTWQTGISAFGEPSAWHDIVADAATELARARASGFSDDEIETVRRAMIAGARRGVATEPTVPSAALARALVGATANGTPFQSAAQRLAVLERLLPGIDAAEVSAAFAAAFDPARMVVDLQLPSADELPTERAALEAASAPFARTFTAPEARAEVAALITDLPEPGAVANAAIDERNGVLSAWLENGVRVHHRHMDERRGSVGVRIVVAGGSIEEDAESRGLTLAGIGALRRFATRSHTSTAIRDLFSETTIGLNLEVYPDAVVINVNGAPDELEQGLQLAYLLLTEPEIEAPAFEQGKQAVLRGIEAAARDVQAQLGEAVTRARFPDDDPRWFPLDAATVAGLERDAAQRWVERLFARGPIEVAIVGEIERERALGLMQRYLGSLPARARISPTTLADRRRVATADEAVRSTLTVETATPRAAVYVGFPGADDADLDDARAMAQAARILSTRFMREFREREGLAYSIGARHDTSPALPGFATLSSVGAVDPEQAERLADLIEAAFAAFAEHGPTDEEVDTARRQFETSFTETARSPGYWLNRLATHTYRGDPPVYPEVTLAEYSAIDAERIHETFRRYHERGLVVRVVVKPRRAAGATVGLPDRGSLHRRAGSGCHDTGNPMCGRSRSSRPRSQGACRPLTPRATCRRRRGTRRPDRRRH